MWTRICRAEEQCEDLIATARGIEGMYIEWRRMERAGLRQVQESVAPLFERTGRFRMYQSWVIPGLLQTEGYTRAVLNTITSLRDVPDDVEAAVAARMKRQHILRSRRRFAVLIEEWVLRTLISDPEVMVGQLGHLIAVASLPSMSLGVIPLGAARGVGWPVESFTMYDDQQVNVELVSAHLTLTQPREVEGYARGFAELSRIAVYGGAARSLIAAAIDALG